MSRRRTEQGAALVEMALILPTLLLVLIGIFELGMAFRSFLTTSYLAREGARMVAFLGTDVDADCTMVTTTIQSITESDLSRIDRIEVFKVAANGDPAPGGTNTYRFTGTDPQDCADWTATVNWPSTTRQTEVGAVPLDVIGVRIVTTHDWVTGFPPFFGSIEVNENTVVRMEPEAFA